MFFAKRSQLVPPLQGSTILAGALPRASLRCALGYHITVPSGLTVRSGKLRNEAIARGAPVQGFRFGVASFGFWYPRNQRYPRFNFEIYETNPISEERAKGGWGEGEKIAKRTQRLCIADLRSQI